MFSPAPYKEDGWYVIPGVLQDGEIVDLFTDGKPVSWEKPPLLSATYKNDRWRSYMMNMWFEDESRGSLLYYARYLCRQWNKSHPYEKHVKSFEIIFMLKVNEINKTSLAPQKIVLWKHRCNR